MPQITGAEPHIITMLDISKEVARARTKFPQATHTLAALIEEVGELAQAMIERMRGNATYEAARAEAVQVACMAIRIIEDGDMSMQYAPDAPNARR